jgi:Family of unknown function (DUF6263)
VTMRETTESTSRRKLGAAAALLLGALAVVAGRADAATLRWKFKPGETLHYQMEQTVVTQATLNDKDIKVTNVQIVDAIWKIESVAADGSAEVSQTIDRMRTKAEGPLGTLEYDSKAGKEPEGQVAALAAVLKLLVGVTFKYKMSARGELTDVRVPDGLVKSLKDASPAGAADAGSMLSEEGLKNMIRESSLLLPVEDLAKGKTWNLTTKMPPSPLGTGTQVKTYTYNGPGEGGETLALKLDLKFEPPTNPSVDVKISEYVGSGAFVFDNAKGRIAGSKVTEKVKTIVTFQGQTINQTKENTNVMKLLEAKPAG